MKIVKELICFGMMAVWLAAGLDGAVPASVDEERGARILLRIPAPASELSPEVRASLEWHLRAATLADAPQRLLNAQPLSPQARFRIADILDRTAQLEPDSCYSRYLTSLSSAIAAGTAFFSHQPAWSELSENAVEIIFPFDYRRYSQIKTLKSWSGDPGNFPSGGGAILFTTFVYLNRPEETRWYDQYPRLFAKLNNHLPADVRRKLPYTPFPPGVKAADLIYPAQPARLTLLHPDLPLAETHPGVISPAEPFKIIVFKNLASAYFENVLKPLAGRTLSDSLLYTPTADLFISSLIMRRLSHHLGPVFRIAVRDEAELQTSRQNLIPTADQFVSRQRVPKFSKSKKEDKALLTVEESVTRFFPVLEAVKAQSIAVHSVPALVENGLISEEDVYGAYAVHLLTLLEKIRVSGLIKKEPFRLDKNTIDTLAADPQSVEVLAALIQFSYFAKGEAIPFDVASRRLNLDREKFQQACSDLARDIVRMMENPTEAAAELFFQRNIKLPPQVEEVLKNCLDMPVLISFEVEIKREGVK